MKREFFVLLVVLVIGAMGMGCVEENYVSTNDLKIRALERELASVQGDMDFFRALQFNMIDRMIGLEVKVRLLENELKQRDGK